MQGSARILFVPFSCAWTRCLALTDHVSSSCDPSTTLRIRTPCDEAKGCEGRRMTREERLEHTKRRRKQAEQEAAGGHRRALVLLLQQQLAPDFHDDDKVRTWRLRSQRAAQALPSALLLQDFAPPSPAAAETRGGRGRCGGLQTDVAGSARRWVAGEVVIATESVSLTDTRCCGGA